MQRAIWLSLTSFLTACSFSGAGDSPQVVEGKIDDYIASLPYLAVDDAAVEMGDPTAAQADGDYSCTTQNLKETRQYDRIVAYAANSDSMYPGAIVSADSVMSGLFTQVVMARRPETI